MKTTLLTAFFLLIILASYAQTKFGIKAGTALSTYEASSENGYIADYNNKTGFMAGIFVDFPVYKLFSVQGDFSVSTQGARNNFTEKYTLPSNTGFSEYTINAKYNFVPLYITSNVYFKCNFETEYGKLALGIGPMVEYGIHGYLKIKGIQYYNQGGLITTMNGKVKLFTKDEFYLEDENGNKIPVESPDKALFKTFNPGLGAMLEYETKWKILAGISYSLGLRDISNDSVEEIRSKSLSIWLGYKF